MSDTTPLACILWQWWCPPGRISGRSTEQSPPPDAQHWMGLSDSLLRVLQHAHRASLLTYCEILLPCASLSNPSLIKYWFTGGYLTGIPHSNTQHSAPAHDCGCDWAFQSFPPLLAAPAQQYHKLLTMGARTTLRWQPKTGSWSILVWWAELVSSTTTIWRTQTCQWLLLATQHHQKKKSFYYTKSLKSKPKNY